MANQRPDPFQAIGDPHRRKILKLLSRDSLSINALASNFDMSRPAVSKHVKILFMAGFITIEEIGRERYCLLSPKGFGQVQQWIDYFDGFWVERLKKLEKVLNDKAGR